MIDAGTALDVARQDLLDVRRARLVQATVVLYVAFLGLVFAGFTLAPAELRSVQSVIQFAQGVIILFVPLVALVATYLAVAGERESGTIRVLLGYPVTRAELFLGKAGARLFVVLASIVLGFVLATAIVALGYPDPSLGLLWGFGVLTLLFATAYVGLAMGISAASGSRSRAMAATIGFYFVFTVLWSLLTTATEFALRFGAEIDLTEVFAWNLLKAVGPPNALGHSVRLLFPPGQTSGAISPWWGPVILLAWALIPAMLGYWRFSGADIE